MPQPAKKAADTPRTNALPLDRILIGDCLSLLSSLPEASVDLVFADPPYNLQLAKTLHRPDQSRVKGVEQEWDKFEDGREYDAFSLAWLAACKRVLKPNGALWVIGSYHNIYRLGYQMAELGFWTLNDVIWQKPNAMPNFRGTRLQNQTEILLWASMGRSAKYTFNYQALKHFNDDKQLGNIWDIPICRGPERLVDDSEETLHPTQKPEALLYRVLLASTNAGDVVLDPFFGTGTTGAVAKKLGRHYIGIEQDAAYAAAAEKRIAKIKAVNTELLETPSKRKEVRVAFGEVVAAGLIAPGTTLTNPKGNYTATVQADASLVGQDGQRGSIHKLGSLVNKAASCNGWDYWQYKGQPIDCLREAYRKQQQA